MRSNRVMTAALLTIAGTGIAHLVLSERRHRDRTVLESARIHQRLLAAQVERPGLRAIWGSLTPLDLRERRLHVHRNAWVSAWEALYRVGALSADGVHGAACALFATPEGLEWWVRVREERASATGDERGRRFHALMEAAYQDETGTVLPQPGTGTAQFHAQQPSP
ncbi:DUF6082 family protein [Streptomyces phaeochromogenes]|uniref:DUF6082 family protein n=1 Tax=Streptomyces phaeochromogenes TaxID=1923 RepID=A0ABZ1H7C3_STRPH|nr:DUF6082 family protein [Streptomyces phaeochromogenes]WSD14452.1 DUF6082 family protein [Streptomyces phaeochromogenes]